MSHRALLVSSILAFAALASAQTASQSPVPSTPGSVLRIQLDKTVHIHQVGESVQATVTEPVYSYDRAVVPAGAKLLGTVAEISSPKKKTRVLNALSGDFSPDRTAQLNFNTLVLPNGTQLPVHSSAAFPAAPAVEMGAAQHGGIVKRYFGQLKGEFKARRQSLRAEVTAPGKMARLKHYLVSQSPYRPSVIEKGAAFDVPVGEHFALPASPTPVSEGTLMLNGSAVQARLLTAVSSLGSHSGDSVEAVITKPLFSAKHELLLPEGTILEGKVLEAQPARKLHRNGKLLFTFQNIHLPAGAVIKQHGTLQAAEANGGGNVELDEEGMAKPKESPTRFMAPLLVVLMSSSVHGDDDGDGGGGFNAAPGAAAGHFHLLGRIVALTSKSKPVSYGLGYISAGASIYSHFFARGRDVSFPSNAELLVNLSTR